MSEVPGLYERGRHRRKRGWGVADRFIPSRRAQGVALVRAQGPQEGPCSDLGLALRALRLPRKLRTASLNRPCAWNNPFVGACAKEAVWDRCDRTYRCLGR